MLKLDMKKFSAIASQDPEFVREFRYFDGRVKIVVGEEVNILNFTDGKLTGVDVGMPIATEAVISIQGDYSIWQNLLAKKPKPFFQCLQTAQVRHGMKVSGTNETFAYLPALNRMISLLRTMINKEA